MVEINWKQCILWIRLKLGSIMVCFNIFQYIHSQEGLKVLLNFETINARCMYFIVLFIKHNTFYVLYVAFFAFMHKIISA